MTLTAHIAVMDLMSLADALLLPEDDLALAQVLKSPLCGLDEDDLFALAYARRGTLWAALLARGDERPRWRAAASRLQRWAQAARRRSPFAFYAQVLGADGGRGRMLSRLGLEANDALDEFLSLALDYERQHTPTLQGFLAWLRASEAEVKRDMDIVRDEVRVMTVHGAKGLEAPVVILADTTTPPAGNHPPRLLSLAGEEHHDESTRPLVWAGAKVEDAPVVALARARATAATEDEHRRLLYVAMTRAADRLIVCGAQGAKKALEGCWFQLVEQALALDAVVVGEAARRWRKPGATAEHGAMVGAQEAAGAPDDAPAWLSAPASVAAGDEAQPLSPSRALASRRPGAQPGNGQAAAARAKGVVVHRLLQSLPAVAAAEREAVARRFLAARANALGAEEADAIVRQVTGILSHPTFAPLFAAETRSEVPIAGRLRQGDGGLRAVSGQIDRLAITPASVLIADFKTDRAPPARFEDVGEAYRTQLALYRAVLQRLYPRLPVRAALVFTESAALVEIPPAALDAALRGLGIDPA